MTDVRLIHGNSARMAEVADAEATLILTSPPYFSDADEPRLRQGGLRDGEIAALDTRIREFAYEQRPAFAECVRVLSPVGALVIQTRDVRLGARLVGIEGIHRSLLEALGLILVSRHSWRPAFKTRQRKSKEVSDRNRGVPHPFDCEVFLVFKFAQSVSGRRILAEDTALLESDILVTPKGQMPQPHRFQAPIPLLEVFIRSFSDPGDLIVDPYAGGATTLVVANSLGRRAIGYEIDAGIMDQARNNLAKRLKGDHA